MAALLRTASPDLLRTPGYALFLPLPALTGLPAWLWKCDSFGFACFLFGNWPAVFMMAASALAQHGYFAFEPIAVVYSVHPHIGLFPWPFPASLERLLHFCVGERLRVICDGGTVLAAAPLFRPVIITCRLRWLLDCFWCWCVAQAYAGGAGGAADQRALVLAAWQIRNGPNGLRRVFKHSPIQPVFLYAPDVAARVEHRSLHPDMRNDYVLAARRVAWTLYLYSRVSRSIRAGEWSQGQRLAFHGSSALVLSRRITGFTCACASSPCLVALFSPVRGFPEPAVTLKASGA